MCVCVCVCLCRIRSWPFHSCHCTPPKKSSKEMANEPSRDSLSRSLSWELCECVLSEEHFFYLFQNCIWHSRLCMFCCVMLIQVLLRYASSSPRHASPVLENHCHRQQWSPLLSWLGDEQITDFNITWVHKKPQSSKHGNNQGWPTSVSSSRSL